MGAAAKMLTPRMGARSGGATEVLTPLSAEELLTPGMSRQSGESTALAFARSTASNNDEEQEAGAEEEEEEAEGDGDAVPPRSFRGVASVALIAASIRAKTDTLLAASTSRSSGGSRTPQDGGVVQVDPAQIDPVHAVLGVSV